MAITKQAVTVIASGTSVAAGTTVTSPVGAASIDVRAFAGGEWAYKITNGSGAPSVAATMILQTSHDGTTWYDYFPITGNTIANGVASGSVSLGRGVMYARAIAYGNTTNAVTVESFIQAVVG